MDTPYSVWHMVDFLNKSTSSDNSRVVSANAYYLHVKERITALLERDPALLPVMAYDALECAILGMRRVLPRGPLPTRRYGIMARLFPGKAASARVHPAFDNGAFSIFLTLLFDATHNLPGLFAPPGPHVGSLPDPAKEIAMTLACLHLLPVTRAAVDTRFEHYFVEREFASLSGAVPIGDAQPAAVPAAGGVAVSPRTVAHSAAELVENLNVDATLKTRGSDELSKELARCVRSIRALAP